MARITSWSLCTHEKYTGNIIIHVINDLVVIVGGVANSDATGREKWLAKYFGIHQIPSTLLRLLLVTLLLLCSIRSISTY